MPVEKVPAEEIERRLERFQSVLEINAMVGGAVILQNANNQVPLRIVNEEKI